MRRLPRHLMQKLRIIQYHRRIWMTDGGMARTLIDLCGTLSRLGHQVTLVTGDARDIPPLWLTDAPGEPRVIIVKMHGRLRYLRTAERQTLDASIRSADVVHLHGIWDTENVRVAARARRMRIAYVISLHGMLDDWSMHQRRLKKRAALGTLYRAYLRFAARFHCTAEAEARQAARWIGDDRSVVIPCLLDLSPYVAPPGPQLAQRTFASANETGMKILFLSRLHPKKGVSILIDAFGLVRDRGHAAALLIAGPDDPSAPDYGQSLRDAAARTPADRRPAFLGMVAGETKISLLQACDLFVLPTSQENFGLALIEAAAAGRPLITTPGVDIWRELQSAGAHICEPDPLQVAAAIIACFNDTDKRVAAGEQLRKWAFEWLEPNRVAECYVDLYRRANLRG